MNGQAKPATVTNLHAVAGAGEEDLRAQDRQVRIDLAAMYRLTALFGWDDTVWNHISARAPGDRGFYIHRFGLLYEEVCASNLLRIDENGTVLDGPDDVNTTGFIIHSAIHATRPEHRFVFHAHPAHVIGATALEGALPFLVQDCASIYGKIGYHPWEGLSLDRDERARIADNLGDGKCLILRNHGLLTVGADAGEAFMNMYYLIRLCEAAIQAGGSGRPLAIPSAAEWAHAHGQYATFPPGRYEWPALLRRCERADPSFKD